MKTVLALGMFDGVHLGHRALIAHAAASARAISAETVVLTFSNHPRELLFGTCAYVSTLALRTQLCLACGADRVDAVPFDASFAAQSPEAFVAWLFQTYPKTVDVVVGYDYTFGAAAAGDGALLESLCAPYGCTVEILPPVRYKGEPCSSTRVRAAITAGDMEDAEGMLGRPFMLSGTVEHNKAFGRRYGYPTANIDTGKLLLPMDGVYATMLTVDGRDYCAVTNVGNNPTVQGTRRTVEAHVPNETLALYGKRVDLAFFERLRGEITFASPEALYAQVAADAESAKKVYAERKKTVYNPNGL